MVDRIERRLNDGDRRTQQRRNNNDDRRNNNRVYRLPRRLRGDRRHRESRRETN